MTLREKLQEIGGVGAPVKIGFDTGWVYAGRLCENYESVLEILNAVDVEKNIELLKNIRYHIEHFEEIWTEKITQSKEKLEHDMNYQACRDEYREKMAGLKMDMEARQKMVEEIAKSINRAETSKTRNMLYLRKKAITQSIYKRRNYITELTKQYKESCGKELSEDEKQEKRDELEKNLMNSKDADWKSSTEKLDFFTTEVNRNSWLERQVLSVSDTIDDDEIEGTKNIIVEGSVYGRYWFSSEMEHDKKMNKLIASIQGG